MIESKSAKKTCRLRVITIICTVNNSRSQRTLAPRAHLRLMVRIHERCRRMLHMPLLISSTFFMMWLLGFALMPYIFESESMPRSYVLRRGSSLVRKITVAPAGFTDQEDLSKSFSFCCRSRSDPAILTTLPIGVFLASQGSNSDPLLSLSCTVVLQCLAPLFSGRWGQSYSYYALNMFLANSISPCS